MEHYIDNFTPRNNRSNQNGNGTIGTGTRLGTNHVISINSNVLEYSDSSSESITNDSDLNEFIEDPNFNIPILGDHFRTYQYTRPQQVNQINNEIIAPHYYKLEFIVCLLISISANHPLFLISGEESNVFLNIFRKFIHFSIITFISYLFTTADTYKSINVSIDFLPINWILYNYPIKVVINYMLVQIVAIVIGSYISVGLYYNELSLLTHDQIITSIMSTNNTNIVDISHVVTIMYAHLISAVGNTIIMEYTNSLSCRYNMFQRIGYLGLISIIYGHIIGPFTLLIYRIILYLSIISIFPKYYNHDDHIFLVIGAINILIKLLIYPFIVYYTKYIWKHKILRYIEYRS